MEYYLWMTGTLPFIILGSIHLIYTFFSNKFSTRNPELEEAMKTSSPILTPKTTVWKAWIGFNASHSIGAIYFGLINFLLAFLHSPLLSHPVVMLLNLGTVLFYWWVGRKYWFSTPLKGISIALIFFVIASVLFLLR